MSSVFDKLNLRPFERRLVVVIITVLFIAAQVFFVWPQFKELALVQTSIGKAEASLTKFKAKIATLKELQKKEEALRGQGSDVPTAEVAIQLLKTAQQQAARSGVLVQNYNPGGSRGLRNNDFFEETTLGIAFNNTGDKELLNFLVAIGGDHSMIRVRDLNLKPDPTGARLQGNLTLVASYQKPTAGKSAAAKPK